MSDFRIALPPEPEFSDRELDWSEGDNRWTVSDKEAGSVTWFFGREPSAGDLRRLAEFFELAESVVTDSFAHLSPIQLVELHEQGHHPPRLVAARCPSCGNHWVVFKWSDAQQQWIKFGRDCLRGWFFGQRVSEEELSEYKLVPAQTP